VTDSQQWLTAPHENRQHLFVRIRERRQLGRAFRTKTISCPRWPAPEHRIDLLRRQLRSCRRSTRPIPRPRRHATVALSPPVAGDFVVDKFGECLRPSGMTRYRWRRQHEQRALLQPRNDYGPGFVAKPRRSNAQDCTSLVILGDLTPRIITLPDAACPPLGRAFGLPDSLNDVFRY